MKRLSESVWGDIRKKSLGQEERIETSIDEYSIDTFFKYLKDTYNTVSKEDLQKGVLNSGNKYIKATIFVQGQNHIDLFYNDGREDEIYLNIMKPEKFEPLVTSRIMAFISIIKDVFVVRNTHPSDKEQEGYGIKSSKEYPKGRNTLYRKVLNMAIIAFSPKTKKDSYMAIKPKDPNILNESVWGDIRKKSLGQETRIEDNIDYMNRDEFCEYLKATYISRRPNRDIIQIPAGENVITIPFVGGYNYMMEICYYEGKNKIECVTIHDGLLMHLDADIYKVFRVTGHINSEIKVEVYPIDSYEVTNSFVVELIDWLLEHSDNKERNLFDKKENIRESVWGDLRKKSLGKEEREETNEYIDNLRIFDFHVYLINRYEVKNTNFGTCDIKYNAFNKYFSIPILYNKEDKNSNYYITYNDSKDVKFLYVSTELSKKFPELIEKLKDEFKVEFHPNGMENEIWISPLNGSITSQSFCIKVIEFIMKNMNEDDLLLSHK